MSNETNSPSEEPEVVERVAKALYMHAVKEAREQIAAEVLPIEKIVAVFEEAVGASDRESAIVVFCLVDDLATDFFRRKLTGKVSSGVDETFLAGNGMLASAYNKIALLAGLQWIQHETYQNLTLMRKIRNEFAHHVEYKYFNDRPICSYIDAMEAKEKVVLDVMDADKRPGALLLRSKFLVRSSLAVMNLVQDTTIIPASIAFRVDPRSIFGGFEEEPENIKTLARTVSRILLEVILNQSPERPS